ncbi:MAG: hypothetical protein U9N34_05885 [Candidatus Cloacimonadota bacterium]|nr:hypothetical protein [Candidatus Cloacimonadota bacterium]
MSQVISYNLEYLPKKYNWNVANVFSFDKLIQFLKQDSILIFREEVLDDYEFKKKITLLKLTYINLFIVIVSEKKKESDFFVYCQFDDLDELITRQRKGAFEIVDSKKLWEEALKIIK